jgi:BirA family biotin operon repressor/biotin-[acetyl-CoA-carboxylase] ligase
LCIASGRLLDRIALAAALLRELDQTYRCARQDFNPIVAEWAQWSTTLGQQLVLRMGERRIEGHAQALDSDGALLLRRDNGQIERILGADVILERS